MFSNTKKSSKTFMSLNPTRNTWFKNISSLLRKERISPDSWDEAIELLVASDISNSTASNLVEEAQEAYEKKVDTNFITASDYLKKAIFQHLNNSKSPIKTQKQKDLLVIKFQNLIFVEIFSRKIVSYKIFFCSRSPMQDFIDFSY